MTADTKLSALINKQHCTYKQLKTKKMLEFKFTVSEKEIQNKWVEQTTPERWIEMYQKLSDSYDTWDVDLKLAEYIISHIKKYVEVYQSEDLPEVLLPLLGEAIKNDIIENNEVNKNITLEDIGDEAEFYAIELLRDYTYITYEDAIRLVCRGYEFCSKSLDVGRKGLKEYTTAELLAEISNRTK
jgi:signal recognition particle GTPase